jgi:hypothetical protein
VVEVRVARSIEVVVGSEAEVGVLVLGGCLHPPSLIPGERPPLIVVGDDVLAELGTDALKEVAEVPDNREVPKDGVFFPDEVVDPDHDQ